MALKFFYPLVIILPAMLFVVTCKGQSAHEGINFFQGTLKEAKEKAKKENKLIFFDAYASWCGPCRYMDSVIYAKKTVGDFFSKNFVSIRVDMEKGEGPELATKLTSIDGYPSLLFLDGDGHVIKTILGSRSEKALLGEAKLAMEN